MLNISLMQKNSIKFTLTLVVLCIIQKQVTSNKLMSIVPKAKPMTLFVMKMVNQAALRIMLTAKTYLICPKMSSSFLDGTQCLGKA